MSTTPERLPLLPLTLALSVGACAADVSTCPSAYSAYERVDYAFTYDSSNSPHFPTVSDAPGILVAVDVALEEGRDHVLTVELVGTPPDLEGELDGQAVAEIRLPFVSGPMPAFPEIGAGVTITTSSADEGSAITLLASDGDLIVEAVADTAGIRDSTAGQRVYATKSSSSPPCYGGTNARDDHDVFNDVDRVLVTPVDVVADVDASIQAPPLGHAAGYLRGEPVSLFVHHSHYEHTSPSASDAQAFFMSAYLVRHLNGE